MSNLTAHLWQADSDGPEGETKMSIKGKNKLLVEGVAFESDSEHHDVRILYPKDFTVEQAFQAGILIGGECMIHADVGGFAMEDLATLKTDWKVVR